MSPKLIIKQFGGEEIGYITQTTEGRLVVQSFASQFQSELEGAVKKVSEHPLTFRYGVTETVEGKTVHKSLSKTVKPGEAEYLSALAEALSQPDVKVNGKRIRGYVSMQENK